MSNKPDPALSDVPWLPAVRARVALNKALADYERELILLRSRDRDRSELDGSELDGAETFAGREGGSLEERVAASELGWHSIIGATFAIKKPI